jgi:hypothetical protein
VNYVLVRSNLERERVVGSYRESVACRSFIEREHDWTRHNMNCNIQQIALAKTCKRKYVVIGVAETTSNLEATVTVAML